MIDLQPFCGADAARPYLMKPFSQGDFSFATNGHIMVRVARQEGVDPPGKDFDANAPLAGVEQAAFAPPPAYTLPPLQTDLTECQKCDGSGHAHECPDCECPCERCDGTGRENPERHVSTRVGTAIYAMRYVRKMLALPDVEIAQPDPKAPLLFRFRDGVGALMPRRCEDSKHVEIFKAVE